MASTTQITLAAVLLSIVVGTILMVWHQRSSDDVTGINAVYISLDAGDDKVLFILMDAAGSINRLGTGDVNNSDNVMYIGVTNEPLFEQLLNHLNDDMLRFMGVYDDPSKKGVSLELSIGLSFSNADDGGFVFRYGSESPGPPDEIADFVMAAVQLTDPWFSEQQKMSPSSESFN